MAKKKNNTGGRLERPRPGSGVGEELNATRNDGLPSPFPDARHPDTGAMGAIVTTVKPGRQRGDIGRAWARRVGTPLGARVPASREGWPRWPGISHLRGDLDLTFLGGMGGFYIRPVAVFRFLCWGGNANPFPPQESPLPGLALPGLPSCVCRRVPPDPTCSQGTRERARRRPASPTPPRAPLFGGFCPPPPASRSSRGACFPSHEHV